MYASRPLIQAAKYVGDSSSYTLLLTHHTYHKQLCEAQEILRLSTSIKSNTSPYCGQITNLLLTQVILIRVTCGSTLYVIPALIEKAKPESGVQRGARLI